MVEGVLGILNEGPMSLLQARKLPCLVGNGKDGRVCIASMWRWATRGIDGVKLETVKVGRIMFTSEAAVMRFLAKLNGGGSNE